MVSSLLEATVAHPGLSFRPVGAHVHDGGVTFRIWAPQHQRGRVATGDGTTTRYITLEPEGGEDTGFFSGRDEHGRAGDLYWIELDGRLLPDLASRFQPRGVEGPSEVVNPSRYHWHAAAWSRPEYRGRVIYELHVGTFTPEGTFAAAIRKLDALVDLGVNTIELMPLGDFPGERNWGYDGVMLFAPARCYGTPDELRALIDAAHARGLSVIVDVVYNHLGPCGNVMHAYSKDYFHSSRESIWGAGLNFDGPNAVPVRHFFLQNVCMWLDEYRVDGLRLDAVHAIHDQSEPHFIAELAATARMRGAFVIAEDDRNDARIISPTDDGGWGIDAMWSDDFHHSMRVAITGQQEAHFANYSGALDEWLETLREGWFYRGQFFRSWKRERGTPAAHLPPEKFVWCISNHDQVGNRPLGDRLNAVVSPEMYRAVSALLCLVPYTPFLFMGQEWAAETPFPYFTDLPGEVGANMAKNRLNEFKHYGATYSPEVLERMPDPQADATFTSAKLDWAERDSPGHKGVLALYRECLRIRAANVAFQNPPRAEWSVDKLNDGAIALQWHAPEGEWLLIVALRGEGPHQPDRSRRWSLVLSTNEMRFGGCDGAGLEAPVATLWRTA